MTQIRVNGGTAKGGSERELVLVFFESRDRQTWTPIERDEIPEWLRDEKIWERLIAGDAVRNIHEDAEKKGMHWYSATTVDRMNIKPSAILLPPRLLVSRPH